MAENESLEEFDFREEWAREQFKKLDSDVAIKLLESTIEKGISLRDFLIDRWKAAFELGSLLMEKGIIKIAEEDSSLAGIYREALAVGIDSSRQIPLRVLSTYYCPITSAIVYFNGINGRAIHDSGSPCTLMEASNLTPEKALQKAKEEMYRCEVHAITRVSSVLLSQIKNIAQEKKILVMIDGPIVDPPNETLYDSYVEERVNAILACKESGALVIGCVKNLEGFHFLNFLKKYQDFSQAVPLAESFGPDPQLIRFVLLGLRFISPWLRTVPIEILEPQWLINEYKKFGIHQVYRIYLTLGWRGALLCTEYFVEEGEDAIEVGEKVYQAVRAWSVPGLSAPLPVLAAHQKCNIRRGAAEFLYRELLTRALSSREGANIIGSIFEMYGV